MHVEVCMAKYISSAQTMLLVHIMSTCIGTNQSNTFLVLMIYLHHIASRLA